MPRRYGCVVVHDGHNPQPGIRSPQCQSILGKHFHEFRTVLMDGIEYSHLLRQRPQFGRRGRRGSCKHLMKAQQDVPHCGTRVRRSRLQPACRQYHELLHCSFCRSCHKGTPGIDSRLSRALTARRGVRLKGASTASNGCPVVSFSSEVTGIVSRQASL